MGSDPMAVVDDQLRVHGIAGLRVADASIMPTLTSGNTNAPSIMIGEKCARMVLEGRRWSGRRRNGPGLGGRAGAVSKHGQRLRVRRHLQRLAAAAPRMRA